MKGLSGLLKELGVEDYNSTSTLNRVAELASQEKQQLTTQPVPFVGSTFQQTSSGSPSQQIGEEIAQYVPSRDSFHQRFGTEEELLPYAAMHQFAEQQVNPEHFRRTVRDMAGLDRQLASTGAWRTGHGQAERGRALDEAERARRGDIMSYMDRQKDLFTDWYGQEMYSYMTGKDPSNYALNVAGLGPGYGDLGWTNEPAGRPPQMEYNPLDMRDYFRPQARSGYQTQPSNLYGTISKL